MGGPAGHASLLLSLPNEVLSHCYAFLPGADKLSARGTNRIMMEALNFAIYYDFCHGFTLTRLPAVDRINLDPDLMGHITAIARTAFKSSTCQSLNMSGKMALRGIPPCALEEAPHLTEVTIRDVPKLRLLGSASFVRCPELRRVTLDNLPKLEKIRSEFCAFGPQLEMLRVNGPMPALKRIEHSFAAGCKSVTQLALSDLSALLELERGAFSDCPLLRCVTVARCPKLHTLGAKCFSGNPELLRVTLCDLPMLRVVGDSVGASCPKVSLVDVRCPSGAGAGHAKLEKIGDGFFDDAPARVLGTPQLIALLVRTRSRHASLAATSASE